MENMTDNNDYDALEEVVDKAHNICGLLMLFEAIDMEEDEVRLFLACNHVTDQKVQDTYLKLVREYDRLTSRSEECEQLKTQAATSAAGDRSGCCPAFHTAMNSTHYGWSSLPAAESTSSQAAEPEVNSLFGHALPILFPGV